LKQKLNIACDILRASWLQTQHLHFSELRIIFSLALLPMKMTGDK
jgi:hypothetical protein